jgi:hypothetical protein
MQDKSVSTKVNKHQPFTLQGYLGLSTYVAEFDNTEGKITFTSNKSKLNTMQVLMYLHMNVNATDMLEIRLT